MEEKDDMQLDILQGLRNILGIECKACGNINPSVATACEECQAPLEVRAEEEESVSFVHRQGIPGSVGQKKVALEEAKYLILLRDTLERARNNEISLEEYQENVKTVHTVANVGMELFNTEVMRNKIAQLPEEQKELATKTGALFAEYFQGCSMMLQYEGSGNFSQAQKGFEIVERVLNEMDIIQDRALAIEASEKEQKWAEEGRKQ